jgi:nucleoside-diphosphate-sugar epimerase
VHILITGGAGFVGSELAVRLSEKNHRVVVMDNLVRRGSESNLEKLARPGVTFVHGDVRNPEDFSNLPAGIEFVCDTSAQPSVVSGYSNPVFDITNNSSGVVHVLEFARRHRCPLIFSAPIVCTWWIVCLNSRAGKPLHELNGTPARGSVIPALRQLLGEQQQSSVCLQRE